MQTRSGPLARLVPGLLFRPLFARERVHILAAAHTLAQRRLEVGRPSMLAQEVTKGLLGERLETDAPIAGQESDCLPGPLVELDCFPGMCPQLEHFPAKWNHFANKKMRSIKYLEHVLVGKCAHFSGTCLSRHGEVGRQP